MDIINDLLNRKSCDSLSRLMHILNNHYSKKGTISTQIITADLIDKEIVEEIKNLSGNMFTISFGKTLRDLKCNISDDQGLRKHEIYLKHVGSHKLKVTDAKLPNSLLHEKYYSSLEEVLTAFRNYINSLSAYFQELENIDSHCTVMEPINPSFKDDFRRILLDKKNWLHIEVSPDGSARNIHLIRQSEQWNDILHNKLLTWDHDRSIVENINCIFDLKNVNSNEGLFNTEKLPDQLDIEKQIPPSCGICFCVEFEGCCGVPQPLCPNPNCDVYFHKSCLFQWLVACEGGCLPPFGVANGKCPTCLQPISCSERDN